METPIKPKSKIYFPSDSIEKKSKPFSQFNNRRLIGRASDRRSKMIAFGYYGGKFSHLDFLLPLLPTTFTHFCEPFGGSAAILINRPPALIETYNDLDSEVTNFFLCLRNNGDELIKAISLTPFSRQELVKACRPEQIYQVSREHEDFSSGRDRQEQVWRRQVPKDDGLIAY
ncbi:MAG: DNA adenine methylase [Syntrophales bacterium]|nr:DNA adenine methylase [Syntrophales bacterium]